MEVASGERGGAGCEDVHILHYRNIQYNSGRFIVKHSACKFSSLLIRGFGFSPVQTQLIGIPSHVIQILSLLVGGLVATKIPNARLLVMSLCVIPSIIGTVLVYVLPSHSRWGRVGAIWIVYTNAASLAVSFSVVGGNVAGFTKKTTVTFLLFLGYCTGNIIAPHCFRGSEEKRGYPTAITAMIASFSVLLLAPLILRCRLIIPSYLYLTENKRRDSNTTVTPHPSNGEIELDLTDIEDQGFRYAV
ncbi:hypothetical protein N7532_004763 [Penicillium argentinense]|uniref:Allantoate permease n=1 Tax=Penicillium argentinense TaxID=1131581 RepID=A0A9W9KF68_9EURO|nr:uncharacterized protein N7532_004763 [Penicillium argentinense]KAJ5104234.1 hypothetical protein N7532_004763 [Penicillium argentinense]